MYTSKMRVPKKNLDMSLKSLVNIIFATRSKND